MVVRLGICYKIRSWVGCHLRSVLYIVERCGLCVVKVWDWDSYGARNECHEGKTIYHLSMFGDF